MPEQEYDNKHVCSGCIGDQILAGEVKTKGASTECSYCGDTHMTFSLDDLADRVHLVIQDNFERSSDEPNWLDSIMLREGMLRDWMPDGEQVVDVVMEITGLPEEIAQDLTSLLSDRYRYTAIKEGGLDPYENEAYYYERSPNDLGFWYSWRSFCDEIMYHERFFPEHAEPVLDDILGGLSALKTYDGTPVIREVAVGDTDFSIWRARVAQSNEDLTTILTCPAQQLGPPPSGSADAGRMNPKGVSVFYGAIDQSTCVAEVRPPVGSHVVLGRFEFLRSVRILDLGTLSKVYVDASYFEPDYAIRKGRAAFIRSLVDEISKPVMPRDVDREYLPTQFVASYLARRVTPRLDGIIFPSSQTEDRNGQNLVLFNHARGVEPYSLPEGSASKVYLPLPNDDDDDDSIFISETVASTLLKKKHQLERGNGDPFGCLWTTNEENRRMTLPQR